MLSYSNIFVFAQKNYLVIAISVLQQERTCLRMATITVHWTVLSSFTTICRLMCTVTYCR